MVMKVIQCMTLLFGPDLSGRIGPQTWENHQLRAAGRRRSCVLLIILMVYRTCCMHVCWQVRSTQCMVRVGNVSKSADAQLCEDAGLTPPPTIQDCGLKECPQWSVGEWSDCRTARCFTLHYGNLMCILCKFTAVTDVYVMFTLSGRISSALASLLEVPGSIPGRDTLICGAICAVLVTLRGYFPVIGGG